MDAAPFRRVVYTVCAGHPRLIDALPVGLPRLIDRLIGAVQRRHPDLLPRALNTLRALLSHANYKSNRVWASLVRLGLMLVGKDDISKDKGKKLAQRGVEDLCRALLIRKITDQEELLSGPGEHDFVDAGGQKKGDGPVNHYDCSALLAYIDPDDVADWDALMGEGRVLIPTYPAPQPPRDIDALYPSPWDDAPAAPVAAPVVAAPVSEPLAPVESAAEEPDPFALPALPATFTLASHDTPVASLIRASLSLPAISNETTSHGPCHVAIPPTNNETEQADGAKPALPSRKIFNETNLSTKTKRYAHSREGAAEQTGTKTLAVLQVLTSSRGKGGRGMDLPGAQALVRDYAEHYLLDLVEYAAWMEARDGVDRGGGWLLNTARGMTGDWPWEFKRHLAAKRSGEARARRQAQEQKKRQAVLSDGVEGDLLVIWPRLLDVLHSQYKMPKMFVSVHVSRLRSVRWAGDTLLLEAREQFSYKLLALSYTDVFCRVLTALLGRPVVAQFVPPTKEEHRGREL